MKRAVFYYYALVKIWIRFALAYLRAGEHKKAETLFQQIIEEKEEADDIYTNLYPHAKPVLAKIYRMKAQYMESERILLKMMYPHLVVI